MGNSLGPGASHSQYNFDYFVKKYGRETMLNVAKDNVRKQQILKKMPQITQKYRNSIHEAKILSVRELNITQANIIQEIEHKIKDIQKNDTGEVYRAEQKNDKSAEDLLGRQEIIKDCNSLRQKIIQSYEKEETKTKQKIQTEFQAYLQLMEKQRKSRFVQMQQLTVENQQAVIKEAEKKFKVEIKSYKKQVNKEIEEGRVVDIVHLKTDYSHLHPKEDIQKLKAKAHELMKAGQNKILGRFFGRIQSREILPQPGFWKCC